MAISVWPFADGHQESVNVFVRKASNEKTLGSALKCILLRLAKLYQTDRRWNKRLLGVEFLQDLLYEKVALAIIRGVLKTDVSRVSRWEFRHTAEGAGRFGIFVNTKREARGFLSDEIRRLSKLRGREARVRRSELLAARVAIERERARCFTLAMSNLYAFDSSGRNIGELDGLWVALSYGKIRVSIVESKDAAKGSPSAIQKQMEDMLKKLKLAEHWKPSFTYMPKTRGYPHVGEVSITLR